MSKKTLIFATTILALSGGYACSDGESLIHLDGCQSDYDCTDSSKPFCIEGVCRNLDGEECQKNSDCTDPSKPVCKSNHCVSKSEETFIECGADADCTDPSKPVCKSNRCVAKPDQPSVECSVDVDCTDVSKPVCSSNHCVAKPDQPGVECSVDADCTDPSKPVCSSNHCVAKPDQPGVECSVDADCTDPSKPVCSSNHCVAKPDQPGVECSVDADCTDPSKPVCSSNHCVAKPDQPSVECSVDADCTDPSKPVCKANFCVAREQVAVSADLLDVVFNADGTAKNVAPTSLTVQRVGESSISTTFSTEMNRNVVHLNNAMGEAAKAYYRVDFGNDSDVKAKIADGHSLEVVFRMGANHPGDKEVKPFAAHEGGGTGILMSTSSRDMAITFLPHVGGSYVWASSGMKPQRGRYYHVVGVWDHSKAYIYVNGQLQTTVDAAGDFKFGSQTWFAIGGDASDGSSASNALNGDIAIARVYSEPLNAARISELYKASKVESVPVEVPFDISDVDGIGSLRVSPGYRYYFYGSNFVEGDYVRFESETTGQTYDAKTTVSADRITAIIPDNLVTDRYRSILVRGSKTAELKKGKILVSKNAPVTTYPRVVAHMAGLTLPTDTYPANSLAALRRAQEANVYAVEIDVQRASDGVIYVTHTESFGGTELTKLSSSTLDKQKLKNGEKLPRFSEFLAEAKKKPTVRVLCDVKWAGNVEQLLIDGNKMIRDLGMEDQVDWIGRYYPDTLKARKYASANSTVMHLVGGSKYDQPDSTMISDNIYPDFSYEYSNYTASRINSIHAAGGIAAVWTPDTKANIQKSIDMGIDAVTTDIAGEMLKMVKVYAEPNK